MTGCTFGKGNFIYKDYGKMALSLLSRNAGRGVRIVLKGETARPDAEHMALNRKMASESDFPGLGNRLVCAAQWDDRFRIASTGGHGIPAADSSPCDDLLPAGEAWLAPGIFYRLCDAAHSAADNPDSGIPFVGRAGGARSFSHNGRGVPLCCA